MNSSLPFAGKNQVLFLASSDIPGIQRIMSKFHYCSALPTPQIRWSQSHMESQRSSWLAHIPYSFSTLLILMRSSYCCSVASSYSPWTGAVHSFLTPPPSQHSLAKILKVKKRFSCRVASTLQLKDHFTTGGWIGRDKARGRAGEHFLVTVMQMGGNKLVNVDRNLTSDA